MSKLCQQERSENWRGTPKGKEIIIIMMINNEFGAATLVPDIDIISPPEQKLDSLFFCLPKKNNSQFRNSLSLSLSLSLSRM
jgi:uncharacterized metal-binding protein